MRRFFCLLLAAFAPGYVYAQVGLSPAEQASLTRALGEAGNSPVDFMRAVENHLKQYPNSPQRAELERAILKTAIDQNDDPRVIRFGESVLARDPDNVQVLEHVATALLRQGDQAFAERALERARHLEQVIQAAYKNDKFEPGGGREQAKRKDAFDHGQASVRLLEARAQGLIGHTEDAIQLAESSYSVLPSVEAAREAARWLTKAGQDQEALQYLADAFTIAGLRSADPDGAGDRARMSELYRKLHGSEAGLGDFILKAYDTTSSGMAARRAELRQFDLNALIKDPIQYTVSGVDGDRLKLSSLLGKVIVVDFWATWCAPCREQHPLYERVESKFKDSGEVVFLSVDTDEDHALVKPFLELVKWKQPVYFEDGLQSLLKVSSIPTTIVFGKRGEVVSRMVGFLPDRFVAMLTERIEEALGKPRPLPPHREAISQ
jgi:thiol-disulfide isomerase/thioredoxin